MGIAETIEVLKEILAALDKIYHAMIKDND